MLVWQHRSAYPHESSRHTFSRNRPRPWRHRFCLRSFRSMLSERECRNDTTHHERYVSRKQFRLQHCHPAARARSNRRWNRENDVYTPGCFFSGKKIECNNRRDESLQPGRTNLHSRAKCSRQGINRSWVYVSFR